MTAQTATETYLGEIAKLEEKKKWLSDRSSARMAEIDRAVNHYQRQIADALAPEPHGIAAERLAHPELAVAVKKHIDDGAIDPKPSLTNDDKPGTWPWLTSRKTS